MLQIRSILASIFTSYIIMASLLPFVTYLRKKGIPKLAAVLIVYITLLLTAFILIFPLIPFLISQVQALIIGFPTYIQRSAAILGIPFNSAQLQDYISRELDTIGANAFLVTKQVFGGLFSFMTISIVSFYLLLNYDTFRIWIGRFFHPKDRENVYEVLKDVDDKLGSWLRGQLFLCYIIGLMTWIALTAIQLPNALPLAVIAGILEAFPTIGPILSSIPAIIVAFTISPTMALGIAGVYVVIQALENQLVVPKVMQKAVGLNPIIVIMALSIGAELMGVSGALLAIPFISFIIALVGSIREKTFRTNLGE